MESSYIRHAKIKLGCCGGHNKMDE